MTASEKIPNAMAEIYSAITALTDAFSGKYLNEEYATVVRRVIGALARKRPSPLAKGKANVWAAAAVNAVGRVNFLDDPSQTPTDASERPALPQLPPVTTSRTPQFGYRS